MANSYVSGGLARTPATNSDGTFTRPWLIWLNRIGQTVSEQGVIKDTANPSGASGLVCLTSNDDSSIPQGSIVLQWNRETLNYLSISAVAAWLSDSLPGHGPFKDQRDANPGDIVEGPYTVSIKAGYPIISIPGRPVNSAAVGMGFVYFTNNSTPDADLAGSVVKSQAAGFITLYSAPARSGIFTAYVLKPWWNGLYFQFSFAQLTTVADTVWRTPSFPVAAGIWYATLASVNPFGVGTELTAGVNTTVATTVPATTIEIPVATVPADAQVGDPIEITLDDGTVFKTTIALLEP